MSSDREDEHLRKFARAFLIPDRRERWADFLVRRPKQIFAKSHTLHGALNRHYCKLISGIPDIPSDTKGVFYDFFDPPTIRTLDYAIDQSKGSDALFSIHAGKLAYFFFHEDEIWQCRR